MGWQSEKELFIDSQDGAQKVILRIFLSKRSKKKSAGKHPGLKGIPFAGHAVRQKF